MKKIRIEFEAVEGYPQLMTIRLWVDEKEVVDGVRKGTTIKQYMLHMPESIRIEKEDLEAQEIREEMTKIMIVNAGDAPDKCPKCGSQLEHYIELSIPDLTCSTARITRVHCRSCGWERSL